MRSEGCYVNEESTDTSWDLTDDLPIFSTADVTRDWRKLHGGELRHFCSLRNIVNFFM